MGGGGGEGGRLCGGLNLSNIVKVKILSRNHPSTYIKQTRPLCVKWSVVFWRRKCLLLIGGSHHSYCFNGVGYRTYSVSTEACEKNQIYTIVC